MVFLITGGINRGKTSRLLSLYKEKKEGDGFILRKVIKDGIFSGYEIVRLSTGESRPFACWVDAVPQGWEEAFSYGPFSFSREGLLFAERIADEIIEKDIEPVYIDEVGPVEIEGRGLYEIVKKLIQTGKTLYLTARSDILNEAIKKFALRDYKVLKL